MGIDFITTNMIFQGKPVKIEIWDTSNLFINTKPVHKLIDQSRQRITKRLKGLFSCLTLVIEIHLKMSKDGIIKLTKKLTSPYPKF